MDLLYCSSNILLAKLLFVIVSHNILIVQSSSKFRPKQIKISIYESMYIYFIFILMCFSLLFQALIQVRQLRCLLRVHLYHFNVQIGAFQKRGYATVMPIVTTAQTNRFRNVVSFYLFLIFYFCHSFVSEKYFVLQMKRNVTLLQK